MGQDNHRRDIEFETAAAATAFAIRSLEEYQRKTREGLVMRKKEDTTIAARVNKKYSKKDSKLYTGEERKTLESAFRQPSLMKPTSPALNPTKRPTSPALNPTKRGGVESKADAWEKAEIRKIRKWNAKMKSTIISWESEKKTRAKRQMERTKVEVEQRKTRNMQHYQHKIANIENVAGGAIVQMEERTASREKEVKEKAKKMRAAPNLPAHTYCFCF